MERSELEEIMRLVDLTVCVFVCLSVCVSVHDCTNNESSNADCYINLPPLQRSGSSFCFPFPCVYITSLGGDMHSHECLLVYSLLTLCNFLTVFFFILLPYKLWLFATLFMF